MLTLLRAISWVTDRTSEAGCLMVILCLAVSPMFPLALLALPVVWWMNARSPP